MIQRIITGAIAIAIFLPIVIYGGLLFKILIYLMATLALYEILKMRNIYVLSFPGIISLFTLWFVLFPVDKFESIVPFSKLEMLFLAISLILTFSVMTKNKFTYDDAGFIVLSTLYIGIGFHYLIETRELGLAYIFLVLFIIWSTDSGAYFIGRAIGKRKLWPEISPKKTIEGAIGGIITGIVVAIIFKVFIPIDVQMFEILIIALLLSIFGQLGDLVESAFKRHFNVKDSGNILPGHGGILDRFDSLIFVLPILNILLKLFL